MKKLSVTGHRPKDLFGYDLCQNEYIKLRSEIDKLVEFAYSRNYRIFISGGAQGVDLFFAESVLKLKKEHDDVQLVMALPFIGQEKMWPQPLQDHYHSILRVADRAFLVDEERYMNLENDFTNELQEQSFATSKLYARNEWMVDNSDTVLAVWTGKQNGGTYHCVSYAQKWGKPIVHFNPLTYETKALKPNKTVTS